MRRMGVIGGVLGVAMVLLGAAPAGAAGGGGDGWQPYRSHNFVDPAGTVCAFGLEGQDVRDGELIRTLAVDGAGNPTVQEITGPLVFRYTNESTGASVERDLSGTAWLYYAADGSQTWVGDGHLGLGIHQGDPYMSPGYRVLSGRYVLHIHAGHEPQTLWLDGTQEDLCRTLSG